MNTLVTSWYRKSSSGEYEFNHVEMNWIETQDKPRAHDENQARAWNKSQWKKIRCRLTNQIPPRVIEIDIEESYE